MPYVEWKFSSLILTTKNKFYFAEKLIRHQCRKCEIRFYNRHIVGPRSRLCASCIFDLYADNRSLDEF